MPKCECIEPETFETKVPLPPKLRVIWCGECCVVIGGRFTDGRTYSPHSETNDGKTKRKVRSDAGRSRTRKDTRNDNRLDDARQRKVRSSNQNTNNGTDKQVPAKRSRRSNSSTEIDELGFVWVGDRCVGSVTNLDTQEKRASVTGDALSFRNL